MRKIFLFLTALAFSGIMLQESLSARNYKSFDFPDSTNSYLSGSIGLADLHQQDKYLFPGIYGGTIYSSALFFNHKTGAFRHEAAFHFSYGYPSANLAGRELTQNAGGVNYSILHNVYDLNLFGLPLGLSAGAGLSSSVMNTNLNSKDKANANKTYDQSWYWSHSLNLLFEAQYLPADDKSFFAKLTLPVFSLISRPENGHWLNNDNSKVIHDNFLNAALQGKPEWPWTNFAMQLDLEYRQAISSRLDLTGRYIFNYASSDRPFAMGMYMNSFLAGIGWKF